VSFTCHSVRGGSERQLFDPTNSHSRPFAAARVFKFDVGCAAFGDIDYDMEMSVEEPELARIWPTVPLDSVQMISRTQPRPLFAVADQGW
jgi:hypothetical protein